MDRAVRDADKKTLEVREDGLAKQKGIRENKQRIKYDPTDLIGCIIRIASALGEWHKKEAADIDCSEAMRTTHGKPAAWCAGISSLHAPCRKGAAQVSISAGSKSYSSDLEDVRVDSIPLSQESPLVSGLADSPASALYR
jgi:hypothetical protein